MLGQWLESQQIREVVIRFENKGLAYRPSEIVETPGLQ